MKATKRFVVSLSALAPLATIFFAVPSANAVPEGPYVDLAGVSQTWKESEPKQLAVFWATWCAECKEKLVKTLPDIDQLPGVSVISINTDEDRERAKHFAEKLKVKLPVLRETRTGQWISQFHVKAVPFWMVHAKSSDGKSWILTDSSVGFDRERIDKALH